jgi:hydrogenase maturation protease
MSARAWDLVEGDLPVDELRVGERTLRVGDRVRLHPHPSGDVFDLALAEQTARVEAVVQEVEGKFHVVVVVDQDPGNGIGPRAPGHRFFFAPDEVELLGHDGDRSDAPATPRVLVAGIGNIFLADDGFGVEVVQRLARRPLPDGVIVADFGIRGYDLACALGNGYEHAILVDACPRGDAPGTVCVLEPDLAALGDSAVAADAHGLEPVTALRLAQALRGPAPLDTHVVLVGCEPATLGPPEGLMGLSEPVEAAVPHALALIETLIARLLTGDAHDHEGTIEIRSTGGNACEIR